MTTTYYFDAYKQVNKQCFQSAQEWTAPTGEEIRSVLQKARLSAEAFSAIIGVEGRSVRRWTGDEVSIPYSAWCLLCLEADLSKFWGKSDNILRCG